MAKIANIDNRNKTIEKPYVYKNKTFEKFLCQYSVFENEVRFENCIFLEEVVLGDESKDQAYSGLRCQGFRSTTYRPIRVLKMKVSF